MSLIDALLLDPAKFQVWIADRTDRQRGSGVVSDPYHGGLNAAGVSQFDVIMNLPQVAMEYAVIHLGPGTFQTKGYSDDGKGGWSRNPGSHHRQQSGSGERERRVWRNPCHGQQRTCPSCQGDQLGYQ